jgi:hypothetical protein
MAQAFQSEIESLFVEDRQLFDLACYPFAREISLSGRQTRALSIEAIEAEVRQAAAAIQRKVLTVAQRAQVPCHTRIMREEPVRALALACAENGPWNVIAIAETFRGHDGAALARLFNEVQATTGIVVAGPRAHRTAGPVAVAVEDTAHLPPMLRAAERLATVAGSEIRIVLLEESVERLHRMEDHARLVLADYPAAQLYVADSGRSARDSALRLMRDMKCGFVIARFGGSLIPIEGNLAAVTNILEGPLLLVR